MPRLKLLISILPVTHRQELTVSFERGFQLPLLVENDGAQEPIARRVFAQLAGAVERGQGLGKIVGYIEDARQIAPRAYVVRLDLDGLIELTNGCRILFGVAQ